MTLVEKVQELMLSDDVDQSDWLQDLYESADKAGKKLLAFVCLCGYSLKTILAGDA